MCEECAGTPRNGVDARVQVHEDEVFLGVPVMCINVDHVHGASENVESYLLTGDVFAQAPLKHGWDVWECIEEGCPSLLECVPEEPDA